MSVKSMLITLVSKVPFGLRKKIKNIPVLKQLQAKLLNNWINDQSFIATISAGPAKGLVFPVQMPQDKLMWIGTWEIEFAEALFKNVQPGWVCYDIGAYKGYYAGIMALRGAKEVHVFEPMPVNANTIKQLQSLNECLPIRLHESAISQCTGNATFKIMPDKTMGKLGDSSFQQAEKEMEVLTVGTLALDDLAKKGIPDPDFIKIDVEGAEALVLQGGLELLTRKRPFLMIEVHSPDIGKQCLSLLGGLYSNIFVLETGLSPLAGTPEICHYIASK